ncbi:MAG: Fe-S-containing hydro-lyase [Firmicutes bacterium]|nr:Fe-S-containing hydro-lyase [Bacillota bacterium]
MRNISITTPLKRSVAESLRAGDAVEISGYIYVARDAAHLRMLDALESGREMPFELEGQVIYYMGPCPAPSGAVIGSAGPTTSKRMDKMTPPLLARGLRGMIGKGPRSPEVIEAIQRSRAVYFAAIGGIGALLSQYVTEKEVIAYPELGAEAVLRLKVDRMPLIVAVDSKGGNLYQLGQETYRREENTGRG